MARSHGRCPRGARLRVGFPRGHRKTTTLVACLRLSGMVAPMVLDSPINGDWFEDEEIRHRRRKVAHTEGERPGDTSATSSYRHSSQGTSSSWTTSPATNASQRAI